MTTCYTIIKTSRRVWKNGADCGWTSFKSGRVPIARRRVHHSKWRSS